MQKGEKAAPKDVPDYDISVDRFSVLEQYTWCFEIDICYRGPKAENDA